MAVADGGGAPPVISPAPEGEAISFAYTERGSDIVGLTIKNALLNIVTLSLYRFWGKTEVRRRILAAVEINGEPMEYLGTGWELFRGFLIIVFGVMLPAGAIVLGLQIFAPQIAPFAILVIYLAFGWLAGFAVYASRRYRFSRASWRGIRFGMNGSATMYAWSTVGYGIATSFTLGWYAPAAAMRLSKLLWEDTRFGTRQFKIKLDDRGLAGSSVYGPYAIFWVVIVVLYVAAIVGYGSMTSQGYFDPYDPDIAMLLGYYGVVLVGVLIASLASIPYQAALMRRQAEMIGLGNLRFSIDARSASLLGLQFTNGLIFVFTLGLGEPIITSRTFRYMVSRLSTSGTVDLETIRQSADRGPKTGEGLADVLDIGGF